MLTIRSGCTRKWTKDAARFERSTSTLDGRLIRTDSVNDSDTSLSWEPLPTLDEIVAQAKFTVEPLTAAEFQTVWDQATDVV